MKKIANIFYQHVRDYKRTFMRRNIFEIHKDTNAFYRVEKKIVTRINIRRILSVNISGSVRARRITRVHQCSTFKSICSGAWSRKVVKLQTMNLLIK